MAVNADFFGYSIQTQKPLLNAVIAREYAVTFATDAAAPLVLPGTPLYQASGLWHVWSHGHRVMGFMPNESVQLSATKQVVANIFSDGEIHYNEILLPAGESQDGLDSELRIVRELRLTIQGLPNADGVADDALDGHAPTLPFIASGAVVYDLTVVNVP